MTDTQGKSLDHGLPPPVRVGLTGEGTYPMVMGGVSTWYDQLLTGLADHEFAIVTLVGEARTPCWEMPANVTSLTSVPMWDPPPRVPLAGRRAEDRRVRTLLAELWRAALPAGNGTETDVRNGSQALRGLALGAGKHRLSATLARVSSVEAIMSAWSEFKKSSDVTPVLTLAQAAEVAHHADRMIAVIDTPWPDVDIIHATSNGPSALLALAKHWADGTPLLLTEHGVYLRERYLALSHLDWPVRAALMGLTKLICQVTYAESTVLAPVSEFNARWSIKLGADPRRVRVVHNGVDVATYVPIDGEPSEPTVSFVGRIDPLKDLDTMIQAFALVVQSIPEAKLRLFGPIPEQNIFYHELLLSVVHQLGLEDAVTFEGRVPNARIAAEAGHVVALSSISEGLPFTVIEAMMCSRPTISTDVGGVVEITGTDAVAGLVVPPRDPGALAAAMVKLLKDNQERQRMGEAGRARA
ncbi:MAG: GT4 family glycosyltransferase PelF, partial [Micrococcaceae bacterium]|nr:GT4 family glycosyltransferase PelF [Micrococcaceae bacterium]